MIRYIISSLPSNKKRSQDLFKKLILKDYIYREEDFNNLIKFINTNRFYIVTGEDKEHKSKCGSIKIESDGYGHKIKLFSTTRLDSTLLNCNISNEKAYFLCQEMTNPKNGFVFNHLWKKPKNLHPSSIENKNTYKKLINDDLCLSNKIFWTTIFCLSILIIGLIF